MAHAGLESASTAPFLNSNEQTLLLNALKSNQPKADQASPSGRLNSDMATINPQTDANIFDSLGDQSFLDSHFDSTNFNWDLDAAELADMQNDGSNDSSHSADGEDSPSNDQTGDKRKADDSPQDEETGTKRRESEGKVAKKPGRKPMTNEPTSKRKAQNRAAQRAFRERKEKHLRDLEQKVDDLEKASEATNHENGVLRAQVDRLTAELSEYKRVNGARSSSYSSQPTSKINWDISQNFDFEFPHFGGDKSTQQKLNDCVDSMHALKQMEKQDADREFFKSSASLTWSPSPLTNTRSMSASTGASNYFGGQSPLNKARSPTSVTDKSVSNSESPASLGLNSSVCTTPEATTDSPQYKHADRNGSLSMSDFRASTSPGQPKTPSQDNSQGLDWFANQNNGLFDPILIDAYREPQDNILNNTDLNLSFFDDAFPWNPASNFSAPFSMASTFDHSTQPKKSLMEKVDSAAEGKEHDAFRAVEPKDDDKPKQITCAKLWERVQRSEKVLNGEADMDDLCSQLKAKAKCGGPNKGAVVDERDVDAILGPDPAKKKKTTGMYGMFS